MYPRDLRFPSVYFIFDAQTRFNMHDPIMGKGIRIQLLRKFRDRFAVITVRIYKGNFVKFFSV